MRPLSRLFFPTLLITSLFTIGLAQPAERKKPEIKNFGSSLERDPSENIDSPAKSSNARPIAKDDETIKIETNVVVFDFLVLDSRGAAVSGLNKDDFVI